MKKYIKKRYKTIFLTSLVLMFLLGYFAGWSFSESTISDLQIKIETVNLELRSIQERINFARNFGEDLCDFNYLEFIGKQIGESGAKLEELELEGRIDTPSYTFLKQRHNINQVLFYSELKKMMAECESEENVALFFFDASKPEEANRQGAELDKLVEEHNLIVIAMDFGFTPQINYFYDFYEVEELPSIIINYEYVLEGFQEKETIELYLN